MQKSEVLEVNNLQVKNRETGKMMAVVEVKLRDLVDYYRYEYQINGQIRGRTVRYQWWREAEREPVPRPEWGDIAIASVNLPEDFEDSLQEPF